MHEVALVVDGVPYIQWKSFRFSASIDSLAWSATFEFTEAWNSPAALAKVGSNFPIDEGADCIVTIDGEVVLVGTIAETNVGYDASSHSISVYCRSKTADIVDCSAIPAVPLFKNKPILAIASELLFPHEIPLFVDPTVPTEPIERFKVQQGETVFEAIDRLAKSAGAFVTTDQKGFVVIARKGLVPSGGAIFGPGPTCNVLSGEKSGRFTDRYSVYVVKGQKSGKTTQAKYVATSVDPSVAAYRPLVIIEDAQSSPAWYQYRADWERNVRRGKGETFRYEVTGFRTDAQLLWLPNSLVTVSDTFLGLNGQLLIQSVEMSKSATGPTTTTLNLVFPESYDTLVPPTPKSKTGGRRY